MKRRASFCSGLFVPVHCRWISSLQSSWSQNLLRLLSDPSLLETLRERERNSDDSCGSGTVEEQENFLRKQKNESHFLNNAIMAMAVTPSSSSSLSSPSTSSTTDNLQPNSPRVNGIENSSNNTCTICGQRDLSRADFNTHIKAHLKEKLNSRRQFQKQSNNKEDHTVTQPLISRKRKSSSSSSSSMSSYSSMSPRSSSSSTTTTTQLSMLPPVVPPELTKIKHPLYPPPTQAQSLRRPLKSHSEVMAELASCKPVPIDSMNLNKTQQQSAPNLVFLKQQPNNKPLSSESVPKKMKPAIMAVPPPPPPSSVESVCTSSEISDMEDDLMSYEMEMNRIDFNNDLSSILDQIEKDFESPDMDLKDIAIETPPDSDSENNAQKTSFLEGIINDSSGQFVANQELTATSALSSHDQTLTLPQQQQTLDSTSPARSSNNDLLGFGEFTRNITIFPSVMPSTDDLKCGRNEDKHPQRQEQNLTKRGQSSSSSSSSPSSSNKSFSPEGVKLVQSADSLAKVGPLPAEALAILSRLPTKLFVNQPRTDNDNNAVAQGDTRFVNVVKVERSSVVSNEPQGVGCTIINIECREKSIDGQVMGKLLETYKAINTGSEIRLYKESGPASAEPSKSEVKVQLAAKPNNDVNKPKDQDVPSVVSTSTCCPTCGKYISAKNFSRHMERHIAKGDTTNTSQHFQCEFCTKSFEDSQPSLIKEHLDKHKRSDIKYECVDCLLSFDRKVEWLKHRKSEHNYGYAKEFSCQFCGKLFTQRGHLNRHEKSHGSVEELRCKVCSKLCKNKLSLVRHRAKHLACVHCSMIFENKISLQDHLLKVHTANAIMSLEYEKPNVISSANKSDSLLSNQTPQAGQQHEELGLVRQDDPTKQTHAAPAVGDSLADISNSNFFYSFSDELNDEFCASELFSAN